MPDGAFDMVTDSVGFIGLGNMGRPIDGHIADGKSDVSVFDLAGTQARAPQGARIVGDTQALAAQCDVIFLSLPTVAANQAVVAQICASARPGTKEGLC
jgi:3-hydroxyisobutyrate dehydrogenase-like beta-hydroxyacid dehydrogenase